MTNWQKSIRNALGSVALAAIAVPALAQVPVDDDGNAIGDWEAPAAQSTQAATGNEGIPLLSPVELQDLVGPVALYPDDLLAIVLPASTYPLQVVQAARFLEELESNPGLKPDDDWDDSIIALLNYPEVIELLNEDLDWTWQLGEAVVAQQADVVAAVEGFRDTAYAAGNLRSDDYQEVSRDEGVIEITPVNDDIIYVPYYEPERVVVYQPRPVYHYYQRPYPVYYYPYSASHAFNRGFFWGVTTAFSIGWATDHLHVYHHSYHGHPYFGRHYYDRWWYRRPSINVHNTVYINNRVHLNSRRYSHGDYWQPSRNTRLRYSDQRITRNTHYPRGDRRSDEYRSRNYVTRNNTNRNNADRNRTNRNNTNTSYQFRDRSNELARGDRSRNRTERTTSQRKPARQGPSAREPVARRGDARQPATRPPATGRPTTRQPLAGERSARQPVIAPTPPTNSSRRRDAARSQPRTEPVRQARNERRSQPAQQARSERRSEPPRQARSERRSQPQQQARSERRSQPQQQARSERRSQPQQQQQQARNERRSESRRGSRDEARRRRN